MATLFNFPKFKTKEEEYEYLDNCIIGCGISRLRCILCDKNVLILALVSHITETHVMNIPNLDCLSNIREPDVSEYFIKID